MITPGMFGAAMEGIGSLVGGISRLFTAHKQKKMADAINPQRTYYQTSPYAIQNRGIALNNMNGAMPGYSNAQNGIQAAQANAINGAQRNATNSGDALAVAAGSQAVADRATENLATQESQYRNNVVNQLMRANQGLVSEGDKVYQDQLLDYQEQQERKNALLGASWENKFNAATGFGNALMEGGNALLYAAMKRKMEMAGNASLAGIGGWMQ